MKVFVSALALFCAYLHVVVFAQEDCMQRAKKVTVNMTQCCAFPDLFEQKFINETIDKVKGATSAQQATPLFDCLVEQMMFKELKLVDASGEFQNDKIKEYIDQTLKDEAWKKLINRAYSKCSVDSAKYGENYQKMTNIPKEQCDFKYDALADCIDIASFAQCPAASWTTNTTIVKDCDFLKSFIKDCYKHIDAINEFLDHQED